MRALVTGGAKRLGKEMAIFLAERGFEVAIHYHSSENSAIELVEYIKSKTGKNSIALRADLTKEIEVRELIARANDQLGGPINCLI
ncbi:MAG: short-chain dehydrogenase, partial [Rhodobacteraceae bacterium]|nr:short-chain dehydrogenase [Paracoccaceae bacterium]